MDFLTQHPFIRLTAHDKALGVLIGSALGDAIGLYTEFLPRTACLKVYPDPKGFTLLPPRTPFHQDSHRDKFPEGDWTDDTDQALTIVLSFLHSFENGGKGGESGNGSEIQRGRPDVVDEKDVARRIRVWVEQGLRCLDKLPLGLGRTIGMAVTGAGYLDDPEGAALRVWCQSRRNAAPNGSLMRTHPLGVMCVGRSLEETFDVAARVGRITHVDPRCVVACCAATALVRGILRGDVENEEDIDGLLEQAFRWVDGKEELKNPELKKQEEDWEEVGKGTTEVVESRLEREEYWKHCHALSFQELQLDDSQKMGYVYKCLGTAILSLRVAMRKGQLSGGLGSDLFEEIITELIMQGGDADTNACVAGALLGAWLGYSRLPPHWEKGIRNREWLLKKAQCVVDRVGMSAFVASGEQKFEADPDTALDGGRGMLSREELEKREMNFVTVVLTKQKERREALEREKAKKSRILTKWFKQ